MELFDIAGLKVAMNCRDKEDGLLRQRSRAYLAENQSEAPDFSLDMPDDALKTYAEKYNSLNLDECHYVFMGEAFYTKLLKFDGLMLHASCIEKDGMAYLFSAKSGVGKSTHTDLWIKTFDNVRMINDDKPAIRYMNGRFYACGTPFSGKHDKSINCSVPIRAIIFIERAKKNRIERLTPDKAIPLFLSQTVRPVNAEYMSLVLELLDRILREIPIYKLYCNISREAALTAYNGINDNLKEVDGNEN